MKTAFKLLWSHFVIFPKEPSIHDFKVRFTRV